MRRTTNKEVATETATLNRWAIKKFFPLCLLQWLTIVGPSFFFIFLTARPHFVNCVTAFTFSLISSFFLVFFILSINLRCLAAFFALSLFLDKNRFGFFNSGFFSFLFSVFSSFYGSFVTFLVVQATLSYMPRRYPTCSLFCHEFKVPISPQWFLTSYASYPPHAFEASNEETA